MQQKIIKRSTVVFLCLTTFCFLILSCNKSEDEKKYDQLRKEVLSHYKSDSNPLKEKAAQFLLNNLMNRYSVEGDRYEKYATIIKECNPNPDTVHAKLLSARNRQLEDKIVRDVSVLTPEYLIDNIDRAFEAWEKAGWRSEIDFNDFCEYVLPYRLGNEPLENWREQIAKDTLFQVLGDTLSSIIDLQEAATYLTIEQSNLKKGFNIKWGSNSANIPDLKYSDLHILTTGTCSNLTSYSIFSCRTMTIPVANDFTPHWANNIGGHDWAAIITKSVSIPYILPIKDSLGNYKLKDYTPSKVYRFIFSENIESHVKQRGYCDFLPGVFNNPRLVDVTNLYVSTENINIPILIESNKNKFAYLAVSDRGNWIPVGWGTIENRIANFNMIGINSIYMPLFISKLGMQPFNYPFLLLASGDVKYLKPNFKNLRRLELRRKNPMRSDFRARIEGMIYGKFQASNNVDFKNAVTYYTIMEYPDVYYHEIQINAPDKYKYLRYLGRDSLRCNIAEIEFYEKNGTKPLKGKVIGTKGNQPLENAFDGNDLTYIDAHSGINMWVGLDLGKPVEISKIRFVSRNDKNHIVIGNKYELFYWDNEWKSLGQQVATDKVLIYDQVPSNCLFLLRNYTEGKEERIFTYENGKQVWW